MMTDRSILRLCIFFVLTIVIFIPKITLAESGMGISFTSGGGLFVASDKAYYGNISTDLYPEVGVMADISMIRLGVRMGVIYRKYTLDVSFNDSLWNWGGSHYEYTQAFIPVQLEFLLAPSSGDISPYFGVMAGAFIPVGDNDDVLPAFSLKAGLEGKMDMFLIYSDIRYTYARDSNFDVNAGGIMLVVGAGIRIGN